MKGFWVNVPLLCVTVLCVCLSVANLCVGGVRVQLGRDLQQYQSQAKQLFRKLNEQSPSRCTLEAGSMCFQ